MQFQTYMQNPCRYSKWAKLLVAFSEFTVYEVPCFWSKAIEELDAKTA